MFLKIAIEIVSFSTFDSRSTRVFQFIFFIVSSEYRWSRSTRCFTSLFPLNIDGSELSHCRDRKTYYMCILLPPGCSLDRKLIFICNLDSMKMKREQSSLRHLIEHFLRSSYWKASRAEEGAEQPLQFPIRIANGVRGGDPASSVRGGFILQLPHAPAPLGPFACCCLSRCHGQTCARLVGLVACRSPRPCPAGAVLCPYYNISSCGCQQGRRGTRGGRG